MFNKGIPSFIIFSPAHLSVLIILSTIITLLFLKRRTWTLLPRKARLIERLFAISLLAMEFLYHIWASAVGRWNVIDSLPLELCSFSLFAAIILLWTGNKHLYDFVLLAGIGGALQALATPVLDLSFPHFRYFHFFYTHSGIILTALYFTWIKGYQPTFKSVIKTMIILNALAVLVYVVNLLTEGNYMFLRIKPTTGSLLDYLGPYPWYLLSLEAVSFIVFICLWMIFRKGSQRSD